MLRVLIGSSFLCFPPFDSQSPFYVDFPFFTTHEHVESESDLRKYDVVGKNEGELTLKRGDVVLLSSRAMEKAFKRPDGDWVMARK